MNTIIYQTIRAGVVLGIALFAFAGEVFAAPTLAPVQANQITKTTVTLVGYVEDTYKTSIVWFEWGESSTLSPMTTVGLVSIFDKGFFQGHLYGLNPDTTYYYRAVAMEGATTVSSPIASFRTGGATDTTVTTVPSAPLAATYGASAVLQNSATLNGYVVPNDSSVSAWFEWGTASFLGYTTPTGSYGSVATSYSNTLWGLSAGTTYYYRAVASNSKGISRGSTLSFTTSGGSASVSVPSVITNSASAIAQTSATLNGYVVPNGYSMSAWFDWGTTSSFGSSTPSVSYGTTATSYNSMLAGLNATTTYYYRAVAQSSLGTVYGNTSTFTTGLQAVPVTTGPSPDVTTLFATELTGTDGKLNGLVSTSADQSSNAWFEWGTSSSLGNKTEVSNTGILPVTKLSDVITGLVRGHTYYYRIVAENPYGKAYGSIISFVSEASDMSVVVTERPVYTKPTITIINHGSGVQSLVTLAIDGGAEAINDGEKRLYHVTWKNESTQPLGGVVLRVNFPHAINFESTTKGAFSAADNAVTVDVKTITSGEHGEAFISTIADRGLKVGDIIVVTANMVYTSASGAQGDAIAYVTHRVDATQNAIEASIFGAGSFLPTTFLGWMTLIILVLILVFLGNHLYGRFSDTPTH